MIDINFKKKYKRKVISTRSGMTFSEVIVTIGIFSIIMVGVNQLFIKSWQNYNLVMHTNEASIAANRGMSDIINVLRRIREADNGGHPILGVGDFDLKVFSDIDKDGITEKVHYYLNGTDLMVGKSNPSGFPLTYPVGDDEVSVLIKNVVNSSAQPLFFYYNRENEIINAPAGSINEIRMIEVNLFVDRREGDLSIKSYASLRNLSDYDTLN
ncbi:MAG: hypothetical protein ACD_7C00312G0012 [uncultured bacterium]|nr:MAG: hypothetical protein ACD_7C00312G0012 [uncultured bacterium]KKP68063.1 MAG: hypothetical protein UR66_C0009G0153 [Candidatus Moranbacteria bacterium GW2011_GWE1_35_17]KKP73000.1 MAG: hypothetical protein UR65_C0009G0004 [Candidatus Moranbacteria bacterium GW2011_GWE2_35_164]KKP84720.1 MAG: hypothetical protein UR83_C0014G0023 [Candidatus Moranbacteria bacterium GW2011_GWF2_35_54]HBR79305.1 hypothetical protein [Candidatus Moranbacteria bacterium]